MDPCLREGGTNSKKQEGFEGPGAADALPHHVLPLSWMLQRRHLT